MPVLKFTINTPAIDSNCPVCGKKGRDTNQIGILLTPDNKDRFRYRTPICQRCYVLTDLQQFFKHKSSVPATRVRYKPLGTKASPICLASHNFPFSLVTKGGYRVSMARYIVDVFSNLPGLPKNWEENTFGVITTQWRKKKLLTIYDINRAPGNWLSLLTRTRPTDTLELSKAEQKARSKGYL